MFKIFRRQGQSISEYAIFIGVLVAAIMLMQIPAKRLLQGRLKDIADNFKTFNELPGNKDSLYSQDLGSNRLSSTYYRANITEGRVSGTQAITRNVQRDTATNNGYSVYKSYEEAQPD